MDLSMPADHPHAALDSGGTGASADEQRQVEIMKRIAQLIACAADLTRAVAYEDGTYIRKDLSEIEQHRSEILMMVYEWKRELLERD